MLGDAQAGGRRPVALAVPDARYHLHVMGATGSGKSTLLTNLVLGDVEAGRGVVVIDPKGDLITDLCDRLPDGAASRTVLIDPEDPDAAPVLNVLSGPDPDLAVDNLVGIFRSIFAAFWGPRTDDVLRSACLTLLRYAAATGASTSLADVPRLLADDEFRAPRVAAVADDTVGLGGFWASYEAMSEASRAQVIGPVMNKLRAFLLRDFVRQVVGRPDSSFDMGQVLDGGVCLVRVPKGILGEETARLLGSFVVAKVWQTATHRARLGQAARVDASPRRRRVPELLAPAPQLRRDAGRGPRLPALHGPRPPAPRPAPQGAARDGLGQRPHQGVVLHVPRGRPRPRPPRRPRGLRARPGPPRRLHRGGPPGRRRRGDPRLHAAHPARAARCSRPGRRGARRQPGRPSAGPPRSGRARRWPGGTCPPARPAARGQLRRCPRGRGDPHRERQWAPSRRPRRAPSWAPPGMEPSGTGRIARQGGAEGSVASADSRGRGS